MNFEEDALKTLSAAIKLNDSNVIAINELALLHQVTFLDYKLSVSLTR